MASITDVLLKGMDDCGETLYRIAKDSGVSYTVIHGFYHGNRDLKLVTANRLAEYLGLELKPRSKRKGGVR